MFPCQLEAIIGVPPGEGRLGKGGGGGCRPTKKVLRKSGFWAAKQIWATVLLKCSNLFREITMPLTNRV